MRKLIMTCVALAAFLALAIMPSIASATNDPDLTHPTGTLLGTGNKLKATNIGDILMTDRSGNTLVQCTKAEMTGVLTKNNGSEIEATIENATFAGTGELWQGEKECTSSFGGILVESNVGEGLPWCLRSNPNMSTNEFQIRGDSCARPARKITLVLNSTVIGKCRYERNTAIPGTYTTHPEDAVLHMSGIEFPKEEGSFLCPGNFFLDITLTLETDTASTDPLYIS